MLQRYRPIDQLVVFQTGNDSSTKKSTVLKSFMTILYFVIYFELIF